MDEVAKGKGLMETFWLQSRKDMGEANDSMVCMWKPKKLRTPKASSSNLSQISETSGGLSTSNVELSKNSIGASGESVAEKLEASKTAERVQSSTAAKSSSDASTSVGDKVKASGDPSSLHATRSCDDATTSSSGAFQSSANDEAQSSAEAKPSPDEDAKSSDKTVHFSSDATKPGREAKLSSLGATESPSDVTKRSDDATKSSDVVTKSSGDALIPSNDAVQATQFTTTTTDDVADPSSDTAVYSAEGLQPSGDIATTVVDGDFSANAITGPSDNASKHVAQAGEPASYPNSQNMKDLETVPELHSFGSPRNVLMGLKTITKGVSTCDNVREEPDDDVTAGMNETNESVSLSEKNCLQLVSTDTLEQLEGDGDSSVLTKPSSPSPNHSPRLSHVSEASHQLGKANLEANLVPTFNELIVGHSQTHLGSEKDHSHEDLNTVQIGAGVDDSIGGVLEGSSVLGSKEDFIQRDTDRETSIVDGSGPRQDEHGTQIKGLVPLGFLSSRTKVSEDIPHAVKCTTTTTSDKSAGDCFNKMSTFKNKATLVKTKSGTFKGRSFSSSRQNTSKVSAATNVQISKQRRHIVLTDKTHRGKRFSIDSNPKANHEVPSVISRNANTTHTKYTLPNSSTEISTSKFSDTMTSSSSECVELNEAASVALPSESNVTTDVASADIAETDHTNDVSFDDCFTKTAVRSPTPFRHRTPTKNDTVLDIPDIADEEHVTEDYKLADNSRETTTTLFQGHVSVTVTDVSGSV